MLVSTPSLLVERFSLFHSSVAVPPSLSAQILGDWLIIVLSIGLGILVTSFSIINLIDVMQYRVVA